MSEKRALIVDDDVVNRTIWEPLLADRGYEVLYAEDVQSALPQVDPSVGLFLIDHHLPDGNGSDLVGMVRRKVPGSIILVISMDDDANVIRDAMQQGGNIFVVKPASPSVMHDLLGEIAQGAVSTKARELISRNGRRAYAS